MRAREDQLLCLCSRQHFGVEEVRWAHELLACPGFDWDLFSTNATAHGVAPLAFENLQPLVEYIPPATFKGLKIELLRNMHAKEQRIRRLVAILPYLADQGIDTLLIKGSALDLQVYRHPYLTISSDYDIVLSKPATEVPDTVREKLDHHFFRAALEYDFFTHHDMTMNGMLSVDFDEIWERAVSIDFRGCRVFVPSPEDLLLAACINSCRKRFFKLKSLMDIAEILASGVILDWPLFSEYARRYRCQNIVYAAFRSAQLLLGVDIPAALEHEFGISPARRLVVDHLFAAVIGNLPLRTLHASSSSFLGREINLQALLPYATYDLGQIGNRIRDFPGVNV